MESIGNAEVVTQMNADTSMSKPKQITGLVVSLLIVFGIASLGRFSHQSLSQHVVSLPC